MTDLIGQIGTFRGEHRHLGGLGDAVQCARSDSSPRRAFAPERPARSAHPDRCDRRGASAAGARGARLAPDHAAGRARAPSQRSAVAGRAADRAAAERWRRAASRFPATIDIGSTARSGAGNRAPDHRSGVRGPRRHARRRRTLARRPSRCPIRPQSPTSAPWSRADGSRSARSARGSMRRGCSALLRQAGAGAGARHTRMPPIPVLSDLLEALGTVAAWQAMPPAESGAQPPATLHNAARLIAQPRDLAITPCSTRRTVSRARRPS